MTADDRVVPFNNIYLTDQAHINILQSLESGALSGDGGFTRRCHQWLETYHKSPKALLTHSCAAALEMCALLLDIHPGDEVIMPSYTFVSTANAFVLRGAVPVFVDIRADTLNIDETLIEDAITPKTKAIVAVHYAGVACEMDRIMEIAATHGLHVIEDAAQGMMATYKGRALGSMGHLGALSVHATKNIISGEGGALLVNEQKYALRAEIIREKGTDRSQFLRGEVDKYTWQDAGSSYLPAEIVAALLWSQLENARQITDARIEVWDRYHDLSKSLEDQGRLRRPYVPEDCQHNGHLYYVLVPDLAQRDETLAALKKQGIQSVFHYVPLHSSPAGKKYGRVHGPMQTTEQMSARLIRLPLWVGINQAQQERIIQALHTFL
jgi:dTDP-4-amino-4,6-dideoxygalactose transaminase